MALREGVADLIAFGRPFIANPDLVKRMKNGWPMAVPDKDTFYTGRDAGYIDYPTYHVD
ncbi:N-ethylmaleimide reductase [compost metagenome]